MFPLGRQSAATGLLCACLHGSQIVTSQRTVAGVGNSCRADHQCRTCSIYDRASARSGRRRPSSAQRETQHRPHRRGQSRLDGNSTTGGPQYRRHLRCRCGVSWESSERYPNARKYNDFRKLIDWEENNIDAVAVCSTDHTHAPASMAGLRAGKHVFCEKPLTHSVFEARTMAEAVRGTNLATQMGNEAHSGPNYRRVVELVRSGAIGEVREVHCWCDQAWGNLDRPPHSPPVPPNLDWDLWLGPAPHRPYHPCYHPVSWRSWWDFGNGRLGDMGCHMLDLPFWALDLKYPLTVEAEGPPVNPESSPLWLICHWEFPAQGRSAASEAHLARRRQAAGAAERTQHAQLPRRHTVRWFRGNVNRRLRASRTLPQRKIR